LRKIGLYFESQVIEPKLYTFGRDYLLTLISHDEEALLKRDQIGANLIQFLEKQKAKLTAQDTVKNWSEVKETLTLVIEFLELISDKIPHYNVIKDLMKEGRKAKTEKMKDVAYYYCVLFIQNALNVRDLKDELYATLLDLFDTNSFDEISVLFNCCKESGLNADLLKEWQLILEAKGKEQIVHILKEEKTHIVENLMEFKRKSDKIIETSFKNNSEFKMGQKKAFEMFLNIEANQVSEYIAKYLDLHLRKSLKTKILHTDEEMETIIQDTLTIFKF
jgi:hypothetical protein